MEHQELYCRNQKIMRNTETFEFLKCINYQINWFYNLLKCNGQSYTTDAIIVII